MSSAASLRRSSIAMTDSKSDAVLHLAVYGTLRDDCPAKMPYRAPFVKGSKAAHGTVRDYELWDNGVNQWPFALPAREGKGSSGAFIKVRLLSWGDAEAFAAKLREADKIEGVDPATGKEDAELFEGYYRERVTAIEDSSGKEGARRSPLRSCCTCSRCPPLLRFSVCVCSVSVDVRFDDAPDRQVAAHPGRGLAASQGAQADRRGCGWSWGWG